MALMKGCFPRSRLLNCGSPVSVQSKSAMESRLVNPFYCVHTIFLSKFLIGISCHTLEIDDVCMRCIFRSSEDTNHEILLSKRSTTTSSFAIAILEPPIQRGKINLFLNFFISHATPKYLG